jgi:hypothetical protein
MSSIFIAYDTRTGRIVSVHHGPACSEDAWNPKRDPGLPPAVLRGPFPECRGGKRYAVDTAHKNLVEVAGEPGVHFGFGKAGGIWQE